MKLPLFSFVSLSALLWLWSDLAAETIYRWVDENGAVHFSDALPETRAMDVKVLEVARVPDAAPGSSHYYSVTNQARRLEKQRLEREKALAEKRKLQAERRWFEEQQSLDLSPEAPASAVYAYPAPNYRPFHPWPRRAGHRYPDDHPAYRSYRPRHRAPSRGAPSPPGRPHSWHPAK